ncbi:MAG: imidazole glycerol phosphate synthase subunit HisH [Acidobacteria bacterium]|nr:MAG: imidazole glycerol phosphate synthase subunit HisH [Acidobacteriota bacterium]
MARAGGELVVGSAKTEQDVLDQAGDAEILWISWLSIVPRRVLEQLPDVRLVMRWGVGYDQIPVRDCTDLGIAVANAPAYGTDDVAEQAIALLVATARQVPWYHNQMVAGGWGLRQDRPIHRMKGRTLGVVGVGRIGSAAARRGIGLGMRVIGYDKYRPADELREMGVEPVGLDEVLPEVQAPLLGVCLGMQLLLERSEEDGGVETLGLVPGEVRAIPPSPTARVPHMGWNTLEDLVEDPLLRGIAAGERAYFVHSYAAPVGPTTLASTTHGSPFSAVVRSGLRWGAQFHPERSAAVGARLLRNFVEEVDR